VREARSERSEKWEMRLSDVKGREKAGGSRPYRNAGNLWKA
jgi:hypothetical protein